MMDTGPQHATAPDVLEHAAVLWCLYSLLSAKLVSAEAAAGHPARDAATWNAQTRLRDDAAAADTAGLALDSLLFFDLAMAVSAFFQLTDSGIEDGLLRARTLGDWASLVLKARRRGARALAFSTSGSTGQPALHRHEWADLVTEAEILAPMLGARTLGGLRRVVCCVPAHHIYGFLFGVLLPALHDLPVVHEDRAILLAHGGRLAQGDLVVGFPWLWQRLATTGVRFRHADIVGISSTGPLAADIAGRLRNLGLARMVEIHGASETGGIGWRDAPETPYELMPHWRPGERPGTLRRRGAAAREVDSPDHLAWLDTMHYWPRGRRDQAVQVGGMNVYPARIAALLESLDCVSEAHVRLMQPGEGDRLKAYIVPANPDTSPELVKQHIRDWCRGHLSAAETPTSLTLGPALPTNTLGKRGDWPIH